MGGVTEVTLFRTMLRPRWIVALILAMAVAAGFAYLGKWQLGRAIQSVEPAFAPTEQVKPFVGEARPGKDVTDASIGQRVSLQGSFVPGDYQLVADRLNHGRTGYWVVGHLTLEETSASGQAEAVAVARGWAPTKSKAQAAARELSSRPASPVELTGRMLPTEAPVVPPAGSAPKTMTMLAVADLVNRWHGMDDAVVFTAYVVEHGAVAGLDEIYSPPPIVQHSLDLLNVFYAIEWAVFAGFALYLWYRVVKDYWERENGDETGVVRVGLASPGRPGDGQKVD
ncbi:MAG TPA: SURF1 family protein [Microbacteriaceae bacterium]|nr:SURF1 family protein [Microbacteriaceae bacterium]